MDGWMDGWSLKYCRSEAGYNIQLSGAIDRRILTGWMREYDGSLTLHFPSGVHGGKRHSDSKPVPFKSDCFSSNRV